MNKSLLFFNNTYNIFYLLQILPGLQAFCAACAIGIGSIYLLQASWVRFLKNFFRIFFYWIDVFLFAVCCLAITRPKTNPSKKRSRRRAASPYRPLASQETNRIRRVSSWKLRLRPSSATLWGYLMIKESPGSAYRVSSPRSTIFSAELGLMVMPYSTRKSNKRSLREW